MPSIHPSESPPLGWLVPCFAVGELKTSLAFYEKLGFSMYGGSVEEDWAMLRNRAIEIHLFHGHIPKDLLNFRGGDRPAIRAALEDRGLRVASEQGEASYIFLDPDGREVFFDGSPEEEAGYANGQPLTLPIPGDVHDGDGMDLGNLSMCLACEDLKATSAFYETLGMVQAGGEPEQGWSILGRRDHPVEFGKRMSVTCLGLIQGMIPADTVNFRGGNVAEIVRTLADRGVDVGDGVVTGPDGGESILIADPDARPILFDTTPPERLYGG
jgi:catechol 2,3-dioxygenase-like lactoylglutathione lyase family enzyme